MTKWAILIIGAGPFSTAQNNSSGDADAATKQFLESLTKQGQEIHHASFTPMDGSPQMVLIGTPEDLESFMPSQVEEPIAETKMLRSRILDLVDVLKDSKRKSRPRSIAQTQLEEAEMWLGKDLHELGGSTTDSPVIDADVAPRPPKPRKPAPAKPTNAKAETKPGLPTPPSGQEKPQVQALPITGDKANNTLVPEAGTQTGTGAESALTNNDKTMKNIEDEKTPDTNTDGEEATQPQTTTEATKAGKGANQPSESATGDDAL